MDIIVFGSAIIDMISYAPRLPKSGETLHGYRFETGFGGKGANQCVAAAKLGAKCALISKIGNDTWGEKYLENLKNHRVAVDCIEIVDKTTGIAQITVADSGENQIIIIPGANDLLTSIDFDKSNQYYCNAKVLICQQETPIEATIHALKNFKGVSILNGAPALENTPKELIHLPTYLCVNETEASIITKLDVNNLEQSKAAALKLIEMGAKRIILTLGKNGAIYADKTNKKVFHIPVEKVERVLDTTGAGDSFIGSFAYLQTNFSDLPILQQIGAACTIAALSVQRLGTQSSFYSFSELQSIQFNLENSTYPVHEL